MIDTKERAKQILEEYANCYSQVDLEELAKYLAEIKAEAIKEFAEKLHEELRIYGIKDKFNKVVFLNVVDKAKKALVGEQNVD